MSPVRLFVIFRAFKRCQLFEDRGSCALDMYVGFILFISIVELIQGGYQFETLI